MGELLLWLQEQPWFPFFCAACWLASWVLWIHDEQRGARTVVALRARHLPAKKFGTTWFWTARADYTEDVNAALQFPSVEDADRWLAVHKHLRGLLEIVEVTIPVEAS